MKYNFTILITLFIGQFIFAQHTVSNLQGPLPTDPNSGFIEITAPNAELGPYNLTMNGNDLGTFQTVTQVSDLGVGTYNFIISDQSGCESDLTITLEFSCELQLVIENITNPTICMVNSNCIENCPMDGSISFEVKGSSNFELFLNNESISSNTTTLDALTKSRYFIRVVDSNTQCEVSEEINLIPCGTSYENSDCIDHIGSPVLPDLPDISSIVVSVARRADSSTEFATLRVSQFFDPKNLVSISVINDDGDLFDVSDELPTGNYTILISNGCESEQRSISINCTLNANIVFTNESDPCSSEQVITASAAGFDFSHPALRTNWFEEDRLISDISTNENGEVEYEFNEFFNPDLPRVSFTDKAIYRGKPLIFEVRDGRTNCIKQVRYAGGFDNSGFASIDSIHGFCPFDPFGFVRFNYDSPSSAQVFVWDKGGSVLSDVDIGPHFITVNGLEEGTHELNVNISSGCTYNFEVEIKPAVFKRKFFEYDEDSDLCTYQFSCNGVELPTDAYTISAPPNIDNEFTNVWETGVSLGGIFSQIIGGVGSVFDIFGGSVFGDLVRGLDGRSCKINKSCDGSTQIISDNTPTYQERVHVYRFLIRAALDLGIISAFEFDIFDDAVSSEPGCDIVIFCRDTFEPVDVTNGEGGIFNSNREPVVQPCTDCGDVFNDCNPTDIIIEFFGEEEQRLSNCFKENNFVIEQLSVVLFRYQNGLFASDPVFSGSELERYLKRVELVVDFENGVGNCHDVWYCLTDYSEASTGLNTGFPDIEDLAKSDCFTEQPSSAVAFACQEKVDLSGGVPLLCQIYEQNGCEISTFCGLTANPILGSATNDCTINLYLDRWRDPSCDPADSFTRGVKKSNGSQDVFETRVLRINLYADEYFDKFQPVKSISSLVPNVVCDIEDRKFLIRNKHNNSNVFYTDISESENFYSDIIGRKSFASAPYSSNSHALIIANDNISSVIELSSNGQLDNKFVKEHLDKVYVYGLNQKELFVNDQLISAGFGNGQDYSYILEFDFNGTLLSHEEYLIDLDSYQAINLSNNHLLISGLRSGLLFSYKQNLESSYEFVFIKTGNVHIESMIATQEGIGCNFIGTGEVQVYGSNTTLNDEQVMVVVRNDRTFLWQTITFDSNKKTSYFYSFSRNSVFMSHSNNTHNSRIDFVEWNPIKYDPFYNISLINIPAEVLVKELFIDNEEYLYFGGELKSDNEKIKLGGIEYINKNEPDRQIAYVSYIKLPEKIDIYSSKYIYNDEECHNNLLIDQPFALNNNPANHLVKSNGVITGKSFIAHNTNVTYQAEEAIILEYPFEVDNGVTFIAKTEECVEYSVAAQANKPKN